MKQKSLPLRKCAGCQGMKEKRNLLRVAKNNGEFSLDITGKKPGRGAYVCHDISCFEMAYKKKGLERSFRCFVPPDIYEAIKDELYKSGRF
jgi:predicted RNA-binding protein YlxR (DUF448 family)